MIRYILVLAALAAVTVPTPASAQQGPPPQPPMSRTPAQLDRHMANITHAQQFENEAYRDQATGNNLGPQPLERIDLANRVSTLIELGRCDEARAMANEAGERMMALRARQMCRRPVN